MKTNSEKIAVPYRAERIRLYEMELPAQAGGYMMADVLPPEQDGESCTEKFLLINNKEQPGFGKSLPATHGRASFLEESLPSDIERASFPEESSPSDIARALFPEASLPYRA